LKRNAKNNRKLEKVQFYKKFNSSTEAIFTFSVENLQEMASIVKIGRGINTKNRFSFNFRGKSQIWLRGEVGIFIN